MKKLYAVDPKTVVRKKYSVQELAKTIADSVKSKRAMTLATDYKWYADALITPYVGYITNLSLCYDGDFTEQELLVALQEEGVYASPWIGQSSFFIVSKEKHDNFFLNANYA